MEHQRSMVMFKLLNNKYLRRKKMRPRNATIFTLAHLILILSKSTDAIFNGLLECKDNPNFQTKFGLSCLDHQHEHCFNMASAFKLIPLEIDALFSNCPYSCNVCQKSRPNDPILSPSSVPTTIVSTWDCRDSIIYADKYGSLCSSYRGVDCYRMGMIFKFTSAEISDLFDNCPISCGLCENLQILRSSNAQIGTSIIAPSDTSYIAPTSFSPTGVPTMGCPDKQSYRDKFGSACDKYRDVNCGRMAKIFKFNAEEVKLLFDSCPHSCRMCPESPSSTPTTFEPTSVPTLSPSENPSSNPTKTPSTWPTFYPTWSPTYPPTHVPTSSPTAFPTHVPTSSPISSPTHVPTSFPTHVPTSSLTAFPTHVPSTKPSITFSRVPSLSPFGISMVPTLAASMLPSFAPSINPSTKPSVIHSLPPSSSPSKNPHAEPSSVPSMIPSTVPSLIPSFIPSSIPTNRPSNVPSSTPKNSPSASPSVPPFIVHISQYELMMPGMNQQMPWSFLVKFNKVVDRHFNEALRTFAKINNAIDFQTNVKSQELTSNGKLFLLIKKTLIINRSGGREISKASLSKLTTDSLDIFSTLFFEDTYLMSIITAELKVKYPAIFGQIETVVFVKFQPFDSYSVPRSTEHDIVQGSNTSASGSSISISFFIVAVILFVALFIFTLNQMKRDKKDQEIDEIQEERQVLAEEHWSIGEQARKKFKRMLKIKDFFLSKASSFEDRVLYDGEE